MSEADEGGDMMAILLANMDNDTLATKVRNKTNVKEYIAEISKAPDLIIIIKPGFCLP